MCPLLLLLLLRLRLRLRLPGDTISFGRRILQQKEVLGVTYVVQYKEMETETQQQAEGGGGESGSNSTNDGDSRPSKRPRLQQEEEVS